MLFFIMNYYRFLHLFVYQMISNPRFIITTSTTISQIYHLIINFHQLFISHHHFLHFIISFNIFISELFFVVISIIVRTFKFIHH